MARFNRHVNYIMLRLVNHDGHLFDVYGEFLRRAKKFNGYVHKYQARGFRAGAMYR
jgi:hypothetical protein